MGTSGSYSGGGGKAGKDLREGVEDWLDSLPPKVPPSEEQADRDQLRLPTEIVIHALGLFRSTADSSGSGGSDGASGGGAQVSRRRNGGAQRSVSTFARSAGRAAAAAYAYRTGNREILSDLGLDYDELQALNDPLELACRIVEAACGPRSEGTIDHDEQRIVAATVAEWVLQEQETSAVPLPDEIARQAIACITYEAISSETGELIRAGSRPPETGDFLDQEIRTACEVLSNKAELSVGGATNGEFARAIENGIETLRAIYELGV